MRELRLCFIVNGRHEDPREPPRCTDWMPDTPANRSLLDSLKSGGIKDYGIGSHWVEEREAP